MAEGRWGTAPRRGALGSVSAALICLAAWLTATPSPTQADSPWGAPWRPSEGLVLGFGGGFGSHYATMGFKGFIGTDFLIAEAAFGTEPFVWQSTYAVGASVLLLDPEGWIRPKLSVLLKSNASHVTVYEPEEEGKIQEAVVHEPFLGLALLAGAEIFPFRSDPGSIEVSVGWRIPFGGMTEVEERADALWDQYAPTGHDVAMPRLDHLSFSLGLNYRWAGDRGRP